MSLITRITGVTTILIALALSLNAQSLPLERRIFILSKTYQSLPIQFAHWRTASIRPQQLDSVYQVFLRRALGTDNRKEFALLMREFIALLNNGHSWYNDNEVFGAALPMGFAWTVLDGKWVVTRSSVNGLTAGDVVLRIAEKDVDQQFREFEKYLNASDLRSKQARLLTTLAVSLPDVYSLDAESSSGDVRHLKIDRTSIPKSLKTIKTESKWLSPGRVGYIKIPSFNKPEFEQSAIEQLGQFAHAPALVIDVRRNGGGSTPERLVRALMNKPYRWNTEGTPVTFGLFRYYAEARPDIELNDYFRNAQLVWQSPELSPDSSAYGGELIILMDRITGSAAEDFVMPFKDNRRALIIGETSAGSTGQPYFFNFGDGISVAIGTKRTYMPNGAEFEGIGIHPDISVPMTREDLYAGKDRALERAMEEANRLSIGTAGGK